MKPATHALALSISLAAALAPGCASPRRLQLLADDQSAGATLPDRFAELDEGSKGFDRGWEAVVDVRAFYLHAIVVEADEDENEEDLGVFFEADIDNGQGLGLRVGTAGDVSFGLLYLTSEHREADRGTHANTHQGYVEVQYGGSARNDWISVGGFVATGVGGGAIDFGRTFDDTGGAAWECRAGLNLNLLDTLLLDAGTGFFVWGYPTETIAYGFFVTTSVGVRF